MNIHIILFSIMTIINIISIFSLIFIERREPSTTWGWLLIITLLPGIGFVLYLCFGQDLSKRKIFNEKNIIDRIKLNNIDRKEHINSTKANPQFSDLIKMNFNHCGALYTNNNSITTYINGEDKFRDLLKDIENAKEFVHIEYYIFKLDNLGNTIVDLLKKKVNEGVEVRLLIDAMGSKSIRRKDQEYIKSLGIEFALFFPGILPLINPRINYRNHRKIAVIDGIIGYVGGFNVGDEYVNNGKKFSFWRDTHLRIEGDAVTELNTRFLMDWDYANKSSITKNPKYFPTSHNVGNIGIQIVSSGPDHIEEFIKNSYLKIINNAKDHIYIQTPYLVLDEPMIEALKISALSGVDVRIMVPYKPDHFYMPWILHANIDLLLDSGIKFYQYNNGFIHAKTIVADSSVASVGTANFDIRSFKLNFEVNAIIYDKEVAKKYEEIFIEDEKVCIPLDKSKFNNRGVIKKFMESIIRLISPIL